MFLIKRIVTIVSGIIGASMGIIFLGFIHWAFSLSITFNHVFFFGLTGGAIAGVAGAYLLTFYLMKKAKKFVRDRFGKYSANYTILKSVN